MAIKSGHFHKKVETNDSPSKLLRFTFFRNRPVLTDQHLKMLNKDIEMCELILAVDTFQDYTTPGSDTILSSDFTVLLHIEEGKKSEDNEQGWVILNFLLEVLKSFWQNGNMPKQAKETVIRPFLKSEEEDPTDPKFYRPIALLSTVRKVYEEILKTDFKMLRKTSSSFQNLKLLIEKCGLLMTTFL